MKLNLFYRNIKAEIISAVFIFALLLNFTILKAQTPANFSGKWEFDKSASDKDKTGDASFDGTIILEIRQNADTITFVSTYFVAGRDGIRMTPDSFLTNGKVTPDHSGSDPAKKFVKWSPDKKVLTTNYVMTAAIDGVAQDFITELTYKLSDDGKTLFLQELNKSKLNGEKTVKKVYRKK